MKEMCLLFKLAAQQELSAHLNGFVPDIKNRV